MVNENFKTFRLFPLNKKFRKDEGGKRILETKNYENKIGKPLITIITTVLNGEKYLEETINSILNQSYRNFEYIIIDGGSTDKTLEIIKRYEHRIDYWISEKDDGLYDGFNKGMQLAFGDFIGIVNSDDTLEINALEILIDYINKNKEIDFIFGSVRKHWGVLYGYNPKKIKYSWGFYSSHSTGFFIKKSSAKIVGLYDVRYKYHADYDYFYRMIVKKKLKGISTKKNEIFGNFRRGGFSSTISFKKRFKEEIRIRYNNGQSIFLLLPIIIFRFFKNIREFFK